MAFGGSQLTRLGLSAFARGLTGSFAGKTTAAAAQTWFDFPVLTEIPNRVEWIGAVNNTGQTLEVGDVLCWDIDIDGRTDIAIPSATNLYLPAGVVIVRDVPDGLPAIIAIGGKPVNAKVLGASGLVAGFPLAPVAGQTYLTKAGFSAESGRFYPFVAAEAWETVSQTQKRVLVRTGH